VDSLSKVLPESAINNPHFAIKNFPPVHLPFFRHKNVPNLSATINVVSPLQQA